MVTDQDLLKKGIQLRESKSGLGVIAGIYHGVYDRELLMLLKQIENLREIVFYVTKISDENLKDIAEVKNLKTLGLISCGNITDKGIAFLSNSKDLTNLSVNGSKVTLDGALELSKQLPKLTIWNVPSQESTKDSHKVVNGEILSE